MARSSHWALASRNRVDAISSVPPSATADVAGAAGEMSEAPCALVIPTVPQGVTIGVQV